MSGCAMCGKPHLLDAEGMRSCAVLRQKRLVAEAEAQPAGDGQGTASYSMEIMASHAPRKGRGPAKNPIAAKLRAQFGPPTPPKPSPEERCRHCELNVPFAPGSLEMHRKMSGKIVLCTKRSAALRREALERERTDLKAREIAATMAGEPPPKDRRAETSRINGLLGGRESGPVIHGTTYAYTKHRCRCPKCKAAKAAAAAEYRNERKKATSGQVAPKVEREAEDLGDGGSSPSLPTTTKDPFVDEQGRDILSHPPPGSELEAAVERGMAQVTEEDKQAAGQKIADAVDRDIAEELAWMEKVDWTKRRQQIAEKLRPRKHLLGVKEMMAVCENALRTSGREMNEDELLNVVNGVEADAMRGLLADMIIRQEIGVLWDPKRKEILVRAKEFDGKERGE
jgi:hypothetical protein